LGLEQCSRTRAEVDEVPKMDRRHKRFKVLPEMEEAVARWYAR